MTDDTAPTAAAPAAPPLEPWFPEAGAPVPPTPTAGTAEVDAPPSARPPRRRRSEVVSPADAAAMAASGVDLRAIPIGEVFESKDNPRKHFDPVLLRELAESLKASGQLTPCLVRPRAGGGYELAAGHRRFRAAGLAGLEQLLCIVRELDDQQFLEILTIENLQRDDLHPLEEAKGYELLIKSRPTSGLDYSAEMIAGRVGKSVEYVYGRLKLLSLCKKAQQLFLDGRFTAGHAVLLARLTTDWQERFIDEEDGYLWSGDEETGVDENGRATQGALDLDDNGEGPQLACSVRQLAARINRHVRLDETKVQDRILFPETTQILATQHQLASRATTAAERRRLRIVHITYQHQLAEDARDESTRTFTRPSWARADGKPDDEYGEKSKPSKQCEHSVLGLVVAGEHRGEIFHVCIDKKKCKTHWPEEVKRAEAAAKRAVTQAKRAAGGAAPPKAGKSEPAKPKAVPFEETPKGQEVADAARHQVFAAKAKEIVAAMNRIAANDLKGLSDAVAYNLAQWSYPELDGGLPGWSAPGKHASSEYFSADWLDELMDQVEAVLKFSPSRPPKSAAGARQTLAFMIYAGRDFDRKAIDQAVTKAMGAALAAAEKAAMEKAAAKAPKNATAAKAVKKPAAKTAKKKAKKK